MAQITTIIPSICFPCEVDKIDISATADESVDITITLDNNTILSTSLQADSSGNITLEDLSEFFDSQLNGQSKTCVITADSDTKTFTFYPCAVKTQLPAPQFLRKSFLSLLNGTKPTYMGAQEYLSFVDIDSAQDNAVFSAIWINLSTNDIQTTTETFQPQAAENYGKIFDASPSILTAPNDGYLLHSYSVQVGKRNQKFILRQPMDIEPQSIRFLNAFGQQETFHFYGTAIKENKPKYSTASFGGKTRNYLIESTPEWKIQTGTLTDSVCLLLEDVATCKKAWRISDGEEVAVTDCDIKISNDRYEQQTATVSFRESGRSKKFNKLLPVRTFDNTFDNTFD